MEPTLCFLLCETPIIYIQDGICRCSGGGLLNHNRQQNNYCLRKCRTLSDSQSTTVDTCGGIETYSAYADEKFYSKYNHLFDYRIQFKSCELWNTSNYYDTLQVNIDKLSMKSSLNKLEQCAAACLDRNSTTKSIAFNGDNHQCLCIMSKKLNLNFNDTHDLMILPNNNCDRYCDNTLVDSEVKQKFKCGSSTDSRVWAIYDLNDLCPIDSIYLKESEQCIFTYKGFSSSCPLSSIEYVYDENVTWTSFLKIIEKLNLTKANVLINFDNNVNIDPTWMCSTTTTTTTTTTTLEQFSTPFYTNFFNRDFSKLYEFDKGCLRMRLNALYSTSLSNHLCITYPINKVALSFDATSYISYGLFPTTMMAECPPDWFAVNNHCYRISNDPKTIQEATNNCTGASEADIQSIVGEIPSNTSDHNDKMKEWIQYSLKYVTDLVKGEIAEYTSQLQARLGFFLLNKGTSKTETKSQPFYGYDEDLASSISNTNGNRSHINEFQMIKSKKDNNSSVKDDSCLVMSHSIIDEQPSSIINTSQLNNCSKPRHALCTIKNLLFLNSGQNCFRKPLTLGLPAMISHHLTHELCLSVCKNLKTNLAILSMNACYCLNSESSKLLDFKEDLAKHRAENCGNPCPGNQYEHCGNNDTIVVFVSNRDLSMITYPQAYKPVKRYLDFFYDDCVDLNSFDQSTIYQFHLTRTNDVHPRHCLELCKNYKQQYALLNSNKCLCTNMHIKKKEPPELIGLDFQCTQECQGNFFYTCGSTDNSSIYSMYAMQPTCPPTFQLTRDEQRCIHIDLSTQTNSFSTAQSYCKSIGGMLVKVNNILEIQDIVQRSLLTENMDSSYIFSLDSSKLNSTKYFWIDRTSNIMNDNEESYRAIDKCLQMPDSIDQNCIALRYEKSSISMFLYHQCLTESDQCSSKSAIPICVDKNLGLDSITILPTENQDSSIISVNTSTDYECGNDTDYHFMNENCYRISVHETTWNDAKFECERDNATLFIPENLRTLTLIKHLFLRQHSYTSSGIVHVGIFVDNQNGTVTLDSTIDWNILRTSSDLYDHYNIGGRRFDQRSKQSIPLTTLSMNEKNQSETQQISCAYVDFRSRRQLSISYDEMSCNRLATVICQKSPILKTLPVVAQRLVINMIDHTNFSMNDELNLTSELSSTDDGSYFQTFTKLQD